MTIEYSGPSAARQTGFEVRRLRRSDSDVAYMAHMSTAVTTARTIQSFRMAPSSVHRL